MVLSACGCNTISMRPVQKIALVLALTASTACLPLSAEEKPAPFKSLSFYEGIWIDFPLEYAQDIKPEDALFAEHSEQERTFFALPPVERVYRNTSLKAVSGARLSSEHVDLTASLALPKTLFQNLQDITPESLGFTFGASAQIPLTVLTAHIKAGHLSHSGSFSHIKNPFFQVPSAFMSDIPDSQSISASLPEFTQALAKEKTLSAYLCLKPALPFVPAVSASIFDNQTFCICANGSIAFKPKTTVSYACTAGTFSYAKTGGTSWFKTEKPFASLPRLSLMAECSVKNVQFSKAVSADVYSAYMIYPNPFGGVFNAYRLQAQVTVHTTGTVSFGGGFSCANENTIDASGSTVSSPWQLYGNIQYEIKGTTLSSKTGLTVYAQEKMLNIKCAQKFEWNSQSFLLSAEPLFEGTEPVLSKVKLQAEYSTDTRYLTSKTKINVLHSPLSTKTVISASEQLSFKNGIVSKLSAETEWSLTTDSPRVPQTTVSAAFTNRSKRFPFTFLLEIKL